MPAQLNGEKMTIRARKSSLLSTGTLSHLGALVLGFLVNKASPSPLKGAIRNIYGTNGAGLCKTENRLLLRHPRLGKPPAHSTYLRNT